MTVRGAAVVTLALDLTPAALAGSRLGMLLGGFTASSHAPIMPIWCQGQLHHGSQLVYTERDLIRYSAVEIELLSCL